MSPFDIHCPPPSTTARTELEQASLLLEGGSVNEAVAAYRSILSAHPDCFPACSGFAKAMQKAGRIAAVPHVYRKFLDANPHHTLAWAELGELLAFLGQEEASTEAYHTAARTVHPALHWNDTLQYGRHWMWDPMLVRHKGRYLLLFLTGLTANKPFWNQGEIHAAESTDLREWNYLGPAITPRPEHPWEACRIAAGSVFIENDTFYFFYSASDNRIPFHESIALATSPDGRHWNRPETPILQFDSRFYSGALRMKNDISDQPFEQHHWRDPWIVHEGDTYHMFFTSAAREKKGESPWRGCVGHATATALEGPWECRPPVLVPVEPESGEPIFMEVERTQVIRHDGWWHMFFSTMVFDGSMNPKWLSTVDPSRLTNSSLYHYRSRELTGPYEPVGQTPVVPGSEHTGLYGINYMEDPDGHLYPYGWYRDFGMVEPGPTLLTPVD